mmetsp:Transcript_46438/g.68216  ORF Transcript_46438/g.68216 Transcript_46438/m.68216 type:complete len:221 (+) Transcript_46438:360-1022(+)
MAKVLPEPADVDWGERDPWQPRRAVTRDFGCFFPAGHQGQYRSWQKAVVDPVTGRRCHEWEPFAVKTLGRNTTTLELGDMKAVEDMCTTWQGGKYFLNKSRPVKGWKGETTSHETGGGWSVGALAGYGEDALARAGGRGTSGGGEGYREQWVPLALQLAQHEPRDYDKTISPMQTTWNHARDAAHRSRVLTKSTAWHNYPHGRSLDGYPCSKDPVLRSFT